MIARATACNGGPFGARSYQKGLGPLTGIWSGKRIWEIRNNQWSPAWHFRRHVEYRKEKEKLCDCSITSWATHFCYILFLRRWSIVPLKYGEYWCLLPWEFKLECEETQGYTNTGKWQFRTSNLERKTTRSALQKTEILPGRRSPSWSKLLCRSLAELSLALNADHFPASL